MAETITYAEILNKKGGPAVLIELADGGKRFTDIVENVEVSQSTVSARLEEGKAENIWEAKPSGSSHRVYVLLPRGRRLAEELQELGFPEIIEQQQKWQAEYEQKSRELKQRFS